MRSRVTVELGTRLREKEVAVRKRVDGLGEQDGNAGCVDVVDLVVETEGNLHAAGAKAEPILPSVVQVEPIHLRIVVARSPDILLEKLYTHPQLVGDTLRDFNS